MSPIQEWLHVLLLLLPHFVLSFFLMLTASVLNSLPVFYVFAPDGQCVFS